MAAVDNRSKIDELTTRIQELPPELFNNIYQKVLEVEPRPIEIGAGYIPPVQLQVESNSRRSFARQYYSSSNGIHVGLASRDCLLPWLASIGYKNWQMLKAVCIDSHAGAILFRQANLERTTTVQLWSNNIVLGSGILRWDHQAGLGQSDDQRSKKDRSQEGNDEGFVSEVPKGGQGSTQGH